MSYAPPQVAYPSSTPSSSPHPAYLQPVDTGPIPMAAPPAPAPSSASASTSHASRPFATPGVIVTGWIALVVFALSHIWVAAQSKAAFVAAGLVKTMLLGMGLGLLSRALRPTSDSAGRTGLAIAGAILVYCALGQTLWIIP